MPYKDKGKDAACKAAYYTNHKEEIAAREAAYAAAHKEESAARHAAYNVAHPEAAATAYFVRWLRITKNQIPPAALALKTAIIAHKREMKLLKGGHHA